MIKFVYLFCMSLVMVVASCTLKTPVVEQAVCWHPALQGGTPVILGENERVEDDGSILITTPEGRRLRATGASCILLYAE